MNLVLLNKSFVYRGLFSGKLTERDCLNRYGEDPRNYEAGFLFLADDNLIQIGARVLPVSPSGLRKTQSLTYKYWKKKRKESVVPIPEITYDSMACRCSGCSKLTT